VELTVLGLATDYCVKFTVLDALALGYTVNVITDGCRGVKFSRRTAARRLWRWPPRAPRCIPSTTGWKLRPDPSPALPRRVFFCRLAIVHKLNSLAVSTGYCW
jgi:hypothetical protein